MHQAGTGDADGEAAGEGGGRGATADTTKSRTGTVIEVDTADE